MLWTYTSTLWQIHGDSKGLRSGPLNRVRGSCGIVSDTPPIGYPPRVHISHPETRDPLISNAPQTSSHEHSTRAIPLSLGEGNRGNLRRSDEMVAGMEPGERTLSTFVFHGWWTNW